MKLTDEQKLEMYKRAIPYLKEDRLGYCSAFKKSLIKMKLYPFNDNYTYADAWKIENMKDFQPFFKRSITSNFLLPYGCKYLQHRINVLKYLINQLEIKLYGEVQTDYSEK